MPDLSTRYLGLDLKGPLVPAASPLSRDLSKLRQMEDSGAAAVVLHSLFEEQIAHESNALDFFLTHGADSYAEALSYFPEPVAYRLGPQQYLEHIHKAKASLGIPVIASLNGISTGGWSRRVTDVDWIRYARLIQEAGADALELNLYFVPTDPELSGDQVEDLYADLLIDVKRLIDIPVAMKLGPYFSSFSNMARRLTHAGANGLVLFNRFYQPDLDIENLEVTPHLLLSHRDELRLPLRWIAILYGRIAADLALSTGVHTTEDVIKGIMAGASVTMMASALLRNGISHLKAVQDGLLRWMEEHEYESLSQMRGSLSQKSVAFPAAYERAQYVQIVGTLDTGR